MIAVPANLQALLNAAATDGMDVNWLCQVMWPAPVGTKYYACRAMTIAGNVYAAKLQNPPGLPKRVELGLTKQAALNEGVTLTLLNAPEDLDGNTDAARIQTLMTEATLMGAKVKLGFCDMRALSGGEADVIKWDGLYQVNRIDRNAHYVTLTCVDATYQPGEKMIGYVVADGDWPAAPNDSYGQVRGPIIGKVDSLPLVPLETGLEAWLSGEIDEQDGVINLKGELGLWPDSGTVQIEDEYVFYPVINRTTRVLGTTTSKCQRGAGFPRTVAQAHGPNFEIREVITGLWGQQLDSITATETAQMQVVSTTGWPTSGVIVIGTELIKYSGVLVSGGNHYLTNLTRGFALPTIPKVHNAGAIVRTTPAGPNGATRYRYLVGEGAVNAFSNVRVVDQDGNEAAYVGTATLSQVTTTSGKNVAVLDLTARPKLETYESGVSRVPPEFVAEDNGLVGAEGFTLPDGFLRWKAGGLMASNLTAQLPYVMDARASGKAAILKSDTANRIFNVVFNAGWSSTNVARYRFGRFKEARLRTKYQYDRQTLESATLEIRKDNVLHKSAVLRPPPGTSGSTGGGGTVQGQQELPKTRWDTQVQRRTVKLVSDFTNQFANGLTGEWINPIKSAHYSPANTIPGNKPADHSDVTDGDKRTFLSGYWNFTGNAPGIDNGTTDTIGTSQTGNLFLHSTDVFPPATSKDKLTKIIVTARNPSGHPQYWTNCDMIIRLRNAAGGTTKTILHRLGAEVSQAEYSLTGFGWKDAQSVQVEVQQFFHLGTTIQGATLGNIQLDIEFTPDVEGQREATVVEGGFFSVPPGGTVNVPSAVFDQVITIGNLAKTWSDSTGYDPWEFFSQNGLDIRVFLQSSAGAVQFALADLELELEYEAVTVNFAVTVVADVDGRTGTPVGGGATVVLENPIDVLAYLVDQSEFLGLGAYRDSASFVTARALVNTMKVSRAVVEQQTVRDLVSSLCAECRLLPLFDAAQYYVKYLAGDPATSDSVGTYGDQADPAKALVRDDFPVATKAEEVANSLGLYYRKNYRTGDSKAVVEVDDAASQASALGRRRQTVNLEWHQSARGYTGGLPEQKAVVQSVAAYLLSQSKVLWEYATIELPAAGAEALQRYDALVLNRERSGYFSALGRVVATQRMDGQKWQVMVRLPSATNGLYWQSVAQPSTFVRVSGSGNSMEFHILGVRVAVVTSAGELLVKRDVTLVSSAINVVSGSAGDVGTPDHESIRGNAAGTEIRLYRKRLSGTHAGKLERVAMFDSNGDLTIYAYDDGSTTGRRAVAEDGVMNAATGASGIRDTGSGSTTGVLRLFLANQVVVEFGDGTMDVRDQIISDAL